MISGNGNGMNGVNGSAGMYSNAHVHVPKTDDSEATAKQEQLEKQAQSLADMLTEDTVEISDEARVLATAARDITEEYDPSLPPVTIASSASETAKAAETVAPGSVESPKKADETTSANQYDTRKKRDAEGERYDAVLKDLREKYTEAEAISRFNDFMRSEGFEVQETITDDTKQDYYNTKAQFGKGASHIARKMAVKNGADPSTVYKSDSLPRDLDLGSHLQSYSSIAGSREDGQTSYAAGTWAVYNAYDKSYYDDTFSEWKNRNIEELNTTAGFDVGKYVDEMKTISGSFAAESVNGELGNMIASILSGAGIELDGGDELVMWLKTDETGKYSGLECKGSNLDDETKTQLQTALDEAVKKDPDILNAFVDEMNSVKEYDLSQLDIAFNSGMQSMSAQQARLFVYSNQQPDAVVMGSNLSLQANGYVYQKKISDEVDYNVDSFNYWVAKSDASTEKFGEFEVEVAELGTKYYEEYQAHKQQNG